MIGTHQPKEMTAFYEKIFDKKPDMQDESFSGWQVGSSFISIGEHSEVKGTAKEPQRIILNLETVEVEKEFERIKALGAKVVKEPYAPMEGADMLIATFSDPDGNYFQLMSPWDESDMKN